MPRAARTTSRLVLLLLATLGLSTPALGTEPVADASGWTDRLDDRDPTVRRSAIHAVAAAGTPEAVEALAAQLEREDDQELRRALQDAMLRVSLDDDQLASLLGDSPHTTARAFAAHSLGHRRSVGTVTVMLAAIHDPEPAVRREVYEALGSSGDRTVIQELIRAAVRESTPSLREQAELAAQRLAASSTRPRDLPAAISVLQGGAQEDRLWAIDVLAESGDWRALRVLLDTASSGAVDIQREAIKALGMLGDHRAVPPLLQMLDETSGRTRHYVIGALALLADESSLEPLGALVRDPDPSARVLAIRALAALGLPRVIPYLRTALEDDEEPVRTEAIHALGPFPQAEAQAALALAMSDPSPFLRAEAARLLGAGDSPLAVEPLLAALDDRDGLVRLTAADALASLGAVDAIPVLERLVERTRDEKERAAYQAALDRLGGSQKSPH